MFLLFAAFIAGVLTVLAPCVLPLLPVIIGGSVSGNTKDKRRPFLIAGSLAVSVIVFTLLLKTTTLLINVPPQAITYFSGGLIVAIGVAIFFPGVYARIMARLGIEQRAQAMLGKGNQNHNQILGPIIIGAALGPVFSSCSPVYGYILATVLPAHFATALAYMVSYVVGLALILLVIGYYGQRFTSKIRFASNPRGWFQRGLAVLFILVGISIITGFGTRAQVYVAAHTPFDFDKLSSKLLPSTGHETNDSSLYNVKSYPAPELTGIQGWINSNPLTLEQLKGKVVLIDFWTYSCINCIRTLPYVEGWYQHYKNDGLVVIGVHAPEFAFEKVPANVRNAVKKDGLSYPIALDNNLATWDAFHNQYWPAEYLIDRNGQVRREHFGEDEYDQTEKAIRGLLSENGQKLSSDMVAKGGTHDPVASGQTPETYLGLNRANSFAGSYDQSSSSTTTFRYAKDLPLNTWDLSGKWQASGDKITARDDSKLRLHFAAKNVYLVAGSSTPHNVQVKLNGQPIGDSGGSDVKNSRVAIEESRLYKLAHFSDFTNGIIELSVPSGTELNVFTFGN